MNTNLLTYLLTNSVWYTEYQLKSNLWSRSYRYWSCCRCYRMTRDWVVWHRPVHTAVPHVAGCGCAAPVSTTDTRCHVPSRAEPALTCCASCMWNQEAACETTTQMRRQCRQRSPSDQHQTSIVAQSSEKHQHTTTWRSSKLLPPPPHWLPHPLNVQPWATMHSQLPLHASTQSHCTLTDHPPLNVQRGSHHSNQYILAIITILIMTSHTKVNNNHTYIHTYIYATSNSQGKQRFCFKPAHSQGNEVHFQNTMNSSLQLLHALYQFSCLWQHCLICKQAPSKIDRYNVTNDIFFGHYPQPAFRPLRSLSAWLDWIASVLMAWL